MMLIDLPMQRGEQKQGLMHFFGFLGGKNQAKIVIYPGFLEFFEGGGN